MNKLPARLLCAAGIFACAFAPSAFPAPAFTLLHYNVKGNGVTDFSTNTLQVKAIGREVMYLQPDIVAFNEIPNSQVSQMTNFVRAFLPSYYLATNSVGDGFIRSVILSRYPIVKGVKPEWRLVKAQQNKLFFNGFSDSRSVSAREAAKWLQNQVFSLVKVRHTAEHDGT